MQFNDYDPGDFYDELFISQGQPRPEAVPLIDRINCFSVEEVQRRQQSAQIALFKMGVTFNVYSDQQGTERILPFDLIPAHRRGGGMAKAGSRTGAANSDPKPVSGGHLWGAKNPQR